MGGSIDIHSIVGEGTTVRIRVPLKTSMGCSMRLCGRNNTACSSNESGRRMRCAISIILIACAETGEALVVDPLDAAQALAAARTRGVQITQVLNTHEHRDHTDGNAGVVAATRSKVLAHAGAARVIGGVDRGLARGDVIRVGRTVELEVLDTPGHTRSHVCLLAHGESPALFCGDTLFNAGAGNCHNGGDPGLLYETFVNQLADCPTKHACTRA
jgi:glyoxylase-like metal-dependent hydrolase (beta-lactamase superfamily II)